MFIIAFSAFGLILVKGTSPEGQANMVASFLEHYTEETAAAIILPARSQLADAGSIFFAQGSQGSAEVAGTIENSTIQANALLSLNSLENDLGGASDAQKNEVTDYTVQEGDALSFIASDFGVSVESIIWANNLKNIDSIRAGQILKIPPVSGIIHKVKSGDTIGSIAKLYGAETQKIIDFNTLPQDGAIQIGEQIVVPDGKMPKAVPVPNSTNIARFSQLPNISGYYAIPATGFDWGRIHGRNGIDIANSCGTSVFASAGGSVVTAISSGWNGGFGKYIKIVHPNGTETLYAHLSQLLVSKGQTVSQREAIALMGTTGRSTGCHLHFEVHGARNPLLDYAGRTIR